MQFIERYKALIITALITSTLVLAAINVTVLKNKSEIAESYYEVEPETIEELTKELEEIKKLTASKNSTNQAYNFKSIDINDFEETAKQTEAESSLNNPTQTTHTTNNTSTENNRVDAEEVSTYNKVSDVLAIRSAKRRAQASSGDNSSDKTGTFESSNPNSNVQFSLPPRKMRNNPVPIYLCEVGGKIVVNIKVNHLGSVISTSINTAASSSTNECLTDHALEYAQEARFTSDASKKKLS